MKVVFLGSSEFSLTVLKRLLTSHHKVLACVMGLDQKVGRGGKIEYSPVKKFCLSQDIPFFQYKSISKQGFDDISNLHPDVLVTASFGQILRQNILDLAPHGVINVHASLLPKYRGSCPANWVIINGEKQTGVTIMQTALSLDTGDMLMQKAFDIRENETAGELLCRLASLGAEMLPQALDLIENGKAVFAKQDESKSSYYPMLKRETSAIDFSKSAREIANFCLGLNPWPVAWTVANGEVLKVYKATPQNNIWGLDLDSYKCGEVVRANGKSGLVVRCGDGLVLLDMVQAPNGKVLSSKALLNGKKIAEGTMLCGRTSDD